MKNNTLNFQTLSNLEESQYPIGEVKLKVGEQDFLVKYQERFKDSEIQELIKEWMLIKEATNEKVEVNMYDISFILVLKHFTDVPFDEVEDILERTEHYIRMTNLLIDLKTEDGASIFEKLFGVLNKEEILKVTNAMKNVGNALLEETQRLQESEEYKKLREYVGESE